MVLEIGEGVDSNAGTIENVKKEAQDAVEKRNNQNKKDHLESKNIIVEIKKKNLIRRVRRKIFTKFTIQ